MTRTVTRAVLAAAALLAGACGDDALPLPKLVLPPPAAAPHDPRRTEGATLAAGALPAPTREEIDAAISRGVHYLLTTQNKDGSWGSPASNLYDIYAPGPGSYEAFQVGSSALDVSALVEVGGSDPRVEGAIRRGTDFLLAHSRVLRDTEDVLYNTWAILYQLEAFARLLAREKDPARRAALQKGAADCVDLLGRYEDVEGGWSYYDFKSHTQHPAGMSTSFETASALVAMKMAKEQGVDVPQRLVDRGVAILGRLRFPNGAFAYSWDHRYWPQGGINKIKGSLARTPACFKALRDWGGRVSDAEVATSFENLRKEGRFLSIARKYPQPHEAYYQNSGYFVFYGYYYATSLLPVLKGDRRAQEAASIASYLVPLQEEDGSWWDYQLYGYHKAYGTGYVLMSLLRCR